MSWRARLASAIAEAATGQHWPANVANPAKTRAAAGDPALRTGCEFLRSEDAVRNDSQGLRKPETRAAAAFSHDSQDSQPPADPRRAERQRRAVELLRQHPGRRRAVVVDGDTRGDAVAVSVAVRGRDEEIAVGDLHIPRDRYDPFAILAALEASEQ